MYEFVLIVYYFWFVFWVYVYGVNVINVDYLFIKVSCVDKGND